MYNADKFADKWDAALANPATARDCVAGSTGLESTPPSKISKLAPKTMQTNRKERHGKI